GPNALTATDTGHSGSAALTVSPLGLDHFVVNPSTTTPTAGSSFTATLSAHDLYDNAATSYTATKTITSSPLATSPAPASTAPSYPANPVSVSAGASTVSITLYKAESPAVTASDGTISGASGTFTVNSAAAGKLAFITQPTNISGGATITPSLVVSVEDTYNNTVAANTSSVTVAIGTNPSGGTLSGTT